MKYVVESRNLVKAFGDTRVVDGIHLAIEQSECFGIIGPNGAGKTSTLRMIYQNSPTTDGELYVLGLNVKSGSSKIKQSIGVVPQDNELDEDFTVLDNLLLYALYFGISKKEALPRARELLRFVKLENYENSAIRELSGGMQRRLTIARAIMNEPKLLILDEPTTGLDPKARLGIWKILDSLKKKGITIVTTTHYMEEAEKLCDRVAIMDSGKIIGEGKPRELIGQQIGKEVVEFNVSPSDVEYYLGKIEGKFQYQVVNDRLCIFIQDDQESRKALNFVESENIVIRPASLDDVFIKVAGHEIGVDL